MEAAYDLSAPFYDGWSWQRFWRAHEAPPIRQILETVRRGRGRPLSLLDAGCGTGWYLEQLSDLCGEQVGLDLSAGMLAVAQHRLKRTLLKQADMRRIPFAAQRFDAVLCTRVLSHLPRIGAAVGEMRRTLGMGGTLVLSDVDATHDYQFTRLPVSTGHVHAETHKHDRGEVFDEVERLGFVPSTTFLIHLDGQIEPIRRRARLRVEAVAGWIGSWRKSAETDTVAP